MPFKKTGMLYVIEYTLNYPVLYINKNKEITVTVKPSKDWTAISHRGLVTSHEGVITIT